MEKSNFTIESFDGFPLGVSLFKTEKPVGVVQIVHGALEHKERYNEFIQFLNKHNYDVIISDLRGHKSSINENYPYGYFNSHKELVDDQSVITTYIKHNYPDKPLYLLGHSLGTLIVRNYLQKYSNLVSKVVLTGSPNYIGASKIGILLANIIILFKGKHGFSKLLLKLYNKPADCQWLSYNHKNIKAYLDDKYCGGSFQNNGFKVVFKLDSELHHYSAYKNVIKDLNILMLSGAEDICTGGEKGVADSKRSLEKAGFRNVKSKIYKMMKHEILNEPDHIRVYKDILEFLEQ